MESAITQWHKQLSYVPEVINKDQLGMYKQYILGGMGGSHLAAGIMKRWKPGINLYVHREYDLPPYDEAFFEQSLCIASSYSGNTEETINFAEMAIERGYPIAIITTGGKLRELAEVHHLPHILLPKTGLQPRLAIGHALLALATLIEEPECVAELHELSETFRTETYRKEGETLARALGTRMPVVYASTHNVAIAYNWKIKCNETAKIPAFYNLFPELNHNEMQGFDGREAGFHFIFLRDTDDHERIQKRMAVTADLLEVRGNHVTTLMLSGDTVFAKVFGSLAIADWMTCTIAQKNRIDADAVPMIEEFKQILAEPYSDRLTGDTFV